MKVICVSRGTYGGGHELAERLAGKLGYDCLSREQLIEAATAEGIQVGKLEMSMVKPGIFSERLALEKDHYLAFSTSYLCERVKGDGLVYHGRTGHLLLPGVSHVLRVRVVADEEYRIKSVMQKLGLDREKARRYMEGVDEDRMKWVHSMYGVSWEDAANYDLVVNLAQLSMENACAALVNVAQLPDFQMTPASRKSMENLHLAAKTRLLLARDERTYRAGFKVRADNGVVTVTYLPQDAGVAEFIPEVCHGLPGLKQVRATMAMTNLLWVQEEFQPDSEIYGQVVEIATKWNAAVELVRLVGDDESPEEGPSAGEGQAYGEYHGGVEDDLPEDAMGNGGLRKTLDELARIGKSGGGRVVCGGQRELINAIDRTIPYTLVVIGDVFSSKGHAAKLRATRDLRSFLGDRIKAPVVVSEELGSHYLFAAREIPKVALFLVITLVIYFLVFSNQEYVLAFLANAGWYADALSNTILAKRDWIPRIIVSIAVFGLVPLVAYVYGNVTNAVLKLIKME